MLQFDTSFSESNTTFSADFSEQSAFNAEFTDSVAVTTSDHRQLQNRDAANQHPISAITDLPEQLANTLKADAISEDFTVDSGVLKLVKATAVEQDNTKPITSAAVFTEVGNIEVLLSLI